MDKVDASHDFDAAEGILYTMAFAFSLEGIRSSLYNHSTNQTNEKRLETHKLYTTIKFFTWRAFGFWTFIGLITDGLLLSAFVLRIGSIIQSDDHISDQWHLRSFQILAFVSPFIWYV